jgi:hypothetical protein
MQKGISEREAGKLYNETLHNYRSLSDIVKECSNER